MSFPPVAQRDPHDRSERQQSHSPPPHARRALFQPTGPLGVSDVTLADPRVPLGIEAALGGLAADIALGAVLDARLGLDVGGREAVFGQQRQAVDALGGGVAVASLGRGVWTMRGADCRRRWLRVRFGGGGGGGGVGEGGVGGRRRVGGGGGGGAVGERMVGGGRTGTAWSE